MASTPTPVDIVTNETTIGPGEIGFKGVALDSGKTFAWPPPAGTPYDWSGIYVGSLEQAQGNIIPESGNGDGYVLKISLKAKMPLLEVNGHYIADSRIPQSEKAAALKAKLHLSPGTFLIPELGTQGKLYQGPLLEEGCLIEKETIVPHALADVTEVEIVEKRSFKKFQEVK